VSDDALDPRERARIAAVWAGRARAERETAASFALVTRRLAETGGDVELVGRLARAEGDERRHAMICQRLADGYAGVAAPPQIDAEPTIVEPVYPGASPQLAALLHTVSLCAINESIAAATLEAALRSAATAPVRAALRDLLGDEIEHGRIGWALLGSLDGQTKQAIAPFLPPLLAANLRSWLEPPADRAVARPEVGAPAHGCPAAAEIEAVVLSTVTEMVLPGFTHVGLDARAATAWFARFSGCRSPSRPVPG
jgi:hypothetical protein